MGHPGDLRTFLDRSVGLWCILKAVLTALPRLHSLQATHSVFLSLGFTFHSWRTQSVAYLFDAHCPVWRAQWTDPVTIEASSGICHHYLFSLGAVGP